MKKVSRGTTGHSDVGFGAKGGRPEAKFAS